MKHRTPNIELPMKGLIVTSMFSVQCSMFPHSTMKPIVLIFCTGNSCRSHMGEGFLRAAAGELVNVKSAGSIPTLASKPNRECGKDLDFFHTRVPAEVPAKNNSGTILLNHR
jgi:hypothetical protein